MHTAWARSEEGLWSPVVPVNKVYCAATNARSTGKLLVCLHIVASVYFLLFTQAKYNLSVVMSS